MAQNQIQNDAEIDFPLWALVRLRSYSDTVAPTFDTFFTKVNGEEGLLLFPSILDAEIFSQRLRETGSGIWQRRRLEHLNLSNILEEIDADNFNLMLAMGFYASDTDDLLLDADLNLTTPILPMPIDVSRDPDTDEIQLILDSRLPVFVKNWWNRIGGKNFSDQMTAMQKWDDGQLIDCAHEALHSASIVERTEYSRRWEYAGCGDECAVFVPGVKSWCFGTLRDRPRHILH